MTVHRYTWKHNITLMSNKGLNFSKPLLKDMIFVNLRTGDTYTVISIHKAKENDRDNNDMPEDVVQTFAAKPLSEEGLAALREQCKFGDGQPEYVILP